MVDGTDSIEIHEERKTYNCSWARCALPKWEGTPHCLTHYVIHGLMKFGIIRPLSGTRSERGIRAINWEKVKADYVAFFTARAKGLLSGDVTPCKKPMEAVALAHQLHRERDHSHGVKITFDHFISLIEYIWKFDRRIKIRTTGGDCWMVPKHGVVKWPSRRRYLKKEKLLAYKAEFRKRRAQQ